ncbi:hypothetical protein MFLO_06229 [Listeria floridensis FSL S10-1187]|uniref:Uncharacterized protein n=1 Tax=Listeria floridensis FSL S10-1187 TaxID=1265817 RepID=A0ABP3AZ89_9LIST|nr:metal-sensing transcriptional repressor [Listeria floridensis]EUJ32863.1 hypothetical protein MFLO_06229 [Listeria floridensis FSL S10-1187]
MNQDKQKAIANRMARIEGHVRKVKEMVQNGRDPSEILIQLTAVRKAVEGAEKAVFKEQLLEFSKDEQKTEAERAIDAFLR